MDKLPNLTFKQYIMIDESLDIINEAPYSGNMGFEEMVKFYRVAKPADEKEMELIIHKNDWEGFRKLIKRVLGIELKDK